MRCYQRKKIKERLGRKIKKRKKMIAKTYESPSQGTSFPSKLFCGTIATGQNIGRKKEWSLNEGD